MPRTQVRFAVGPEGRLIVSRCADGLERPPTISSKAPDCAHCDGDGPRFVSCHGYGMVILPCSTCGRHDAGWSRMMLITCGLFSAPILIISALLLL